MPLKRELEKRGYLRNLWKASRAKEIIKDLYTMNYQIRESLE
jgi:hypothetical protein